MPSRWRCSAGAPRPACSCITTAGRSTQRRRAFFATLKRELVPDPPWATREEARAALFDYLERWYNPGRRQSTLEYRTPHEHAQYLARA